MAKRQPKTYTYITDLVWQQEKKGIMRSDQKPAVEVATPPEFNGHPDIWSPEDLFVAAVNSCIMTTFLYYVGRKKVNVSSYESRGEGNLEFKEMRLVFTEIKIFPKIKVKTKDDIENARACIEAAEKNCLVSNSINSVVNVTPEIAVDRV